MTSPLHHLLLCFFCIVYYCQHNEPTICFYYTIVVVSCCIILHELYMMFGSQVRFRFVDPDICFNPYCFDPQLTDKFCPNLLTNRFQTTWVFLRIGSNWMENWFDLEPSSDIMTWQTWGGQLKPQLTPAAGPETWGDNRNLKGGLVSGEPLGWPGVSQNRGYPKSPPIGVPK